MPPSILRFAAILLFGFACSGAASPPQPEPSPSGRAPNEPRGARPTAAPAEPDPTTVPSAEAAAAPEPRRSPPRLDLWGELLARFATPDGGFRYAALAADPRQHERLRAVVAAIGDASDEGWNRDEALAFYINAYNALTVASVLELWPIASVMEVEGFFDERTHQVAGREMTLNELENDILRSDVYAEPRIHFAVNCASASCPPLQAEPFAAETLDVALATAARSFVRATTRREGRVVRLSKLFEWFAADFERVGGVRAFVASQLPEADADAVRDPRTRLRYDEYDWSLNARP